MVVIVELRETEQHVNYDLTEPASTSGADTSVLKDTDKVFECCRRVFDEQCLLATEESYQCYWDVRADQLISPQGMTR